MQHSLFYCFLFFLFLSTAFAKLPNCTDSEKIGCPNDRYRLLCNNLCCTDRRFHTCYHPRVNVTTCPFYESARTISYPYWDQYCLPGTHPCYTKYDPVSRRSYIEGCCENYIDPTCVPDDAKIILKIGGIVFGILLIASVVGFGIYYYIKRRNVCAYESLSNDN